MQSLRLILKLMAPIFFSVGGLHLALGPGADVLLGAQLSREVLADPTLDSQNRFYGLARLVSMALLGLPPAPVLFLLAVELIAPPGLVICVLRTVPPTGVGSPSK